jgi:hypothetical protein
MSENKLDVLVQEVILGKPCLYQCVGHSPNSPARMSIGSPSTFEEAKAIFDREKDTKFGLAWEISIAKIADEEYSKSSGVVIDTMIQNNWLFKLEYSKNHEWICQFIGDGKVVQASSDIRDEAVCLAAVNCFTPNMKKVIEFATECHQGQFRLDGKPYITHPAKVAAIVMTFTNDSDVIASAYLHDVIEDTPTTIEELTLKFGQRITSFVVELTSSEIAINKIGKVSYLIKKMNNMSPEALLVKLADRLDNVSDLPEGNFSKKYKKQTQCILQGLDRQLLPAHKVLISQIAKIVD